MATTIKPGHFNQLQSECTDLANEFLVLAELDATLDAALEALDSQAAV